MEYQAPYGSTDPDASYVDRNSPSATAGSRVPAKAVEDPQREIVAVIEAAGLTPDEEDTTQLLQALKYFFAQFPIFPQVKNTAGHFSVTSPSTGVVQIPAGIEWVMRGAVPYTSVLTTLTTIANKVYHLRWDKDNGWRLRDLADTGYNPTAADESNAGFDSSYDDMLVAKVTTNGSNVVTIVNLINKAKLIKQVNRRDTLAEALDWTTLSGSATTLNWARTPDVVNIGMNEWRSYNAGPDGNVMPESAGTARALGARVPSSGANRQQVPALEYYYEDSARNFGIASWIVLAMAL